MKCRPITVSFRHFKDREDVLKASKFLKVSDDYVYITEDISKTTRQAQSELRKFLNLVRKSDPDIKGFIDHDKLFIDGEIFVYNSTKKCVEQINSQSKEKQKQ